MKKEMFRYFLRKNFKEAENESNENVDALCLEFSDYLKTNLPSEIINRIIPKDIMEIILNLDHPLKTNGFEPALFIHFDNFIEKKKKEYNNEP